MNEPGTESGNLTRMAILALGESLAADRASPAEEVRADVADLTASAAGSLETGTDEGTCREASVELLVEQPESWRADAAVLGAADDRFRAARLTPKEHREGAAVAATVPVVSGWTVVRFRRLPAR